MSSERSNADPFRTTLNLAVAKIAAALAQLGTTNAAVLIDGRSGSGKTTLAALLTQQWPLAGRVQTVALDALYPGWDGLQAGSDYARDEILVPHARGLIGTWQRWDWVTNERTVASAVDPSLALVVEGCGVLTARTSRMADVTVWVDGPEASRKARALERDGESYRPHWERWAAQERAHIAREQPAQLADIVITTP